MTAPYHTSCHKTATSANHAPKQKRLRYSEWQFPQESQKLPLCKIDGTADSRMLHYEAGHANSDC